jgi:CDP-diacylglycerol pyrophosphatase
MLVRFKSITFQASAAAITLCAASLLWVGARAAQTEIPRDALWEIVHSACVPGEMQNHDPRPCTVVDLHGGADKGFAILKDLRGATQYLLIPTAEIAGIESPNLEAPNTPNYFAEAWEARKYVNEALHKVLPREDISLAINSRVSRSQDQLHIHVDCVREDVRAALLLHNAEITEKWARLQFPLGVHFYMAMWVPGETLGAADPFKLVAEGLPGATRNMGDRTLVVVGATRYNRTPGFIVLEDQSDGTMKDTAAGEELQDHACHVAASPLASSN